MKVHEVRCLLKTLLFLRLINVLPVLLQFQLIKRYILLLSKQIPLHLD
jgi:hypothetical protein